MTAEQVALLATAASIGFFHTLLGPDHYLPFVMMGWARKWSMTRTVVITALCGLGHIVGSVLLGLVGISIGLALGLIEKIEEMRGNVAAWLLVGFGLAYLMWAVRKLWRDKPHVHAHGHDASGHAHEHTHQGEHVHVHDKAKKATTAWALFLIFVFGPCEPLVPILMYPAAKNSWADLIAVTATFGFVTLATMIGMVFLCRAGVNLTIFKKLHKFGHIIGGLAILICGLAVAVLGL